MKSFALLVLLMSFPAWAKGFGGEKLKEEVLFVVSQQEGQICLYSTDGNSIAGAGATIWNRYLPIENLADKYEAVSITKVSFAKEKVLSLLEKPKSAREQTHLDQITGFLDGELLLVSPVGFYKNKKRGGLGSAGTAPMMLAYKTAESLKNFAKQAGSEESVSCQKKITAAGEEN